MNPGHRRVALRGGAGRRGALGAGIAGVRPSRRAGAGAGAARRLAQPKVVLPQAVPAIPADAAHLGSAPPDQVLNLDVALAGQDPAGLAQAVAAVSTPDRPTTGTT